MALELQICLEILRDFSGKPRQKLDTLLILVAFTTSNSSGMHYFALHQVLW